MTAFYLPFRCLKLDFIQQGMCANFTFATDYYYYEYTNYENLSNFNMILQQIEPVITVDLIFLCYEFATYYFCNYVFPPCDLTTGAPRAICSESCDYFVTHCAKVYSLLVIYLEAYEVLKYINIDCSNTLNLQQDYGFPCSSNSLQNNCIDLLGMLKCVNMILSLHF